MNKFIYYLVMKLLSPLPVMFFAFFLAVYSSRLKEITMFSILLKICFNQLNSILKKTTFLIVTMLLATTNLAHAGEASPDKFKIALGGYTLLRYDTTR